MYSTADRFDSPSRFTIGVLVEGDTTCQHKDFDRVTGPAVGNAPRKVTLTCKSCGRVEIQRPYAR